MSSSLVSVLTLCFLPEEESLAKVAKVEIPSVPLGAAVPRPYGTVYQPQQVPGAVRPLYVHYILCSIATFLSSLLRLYNIELWLRMTFPLLFSYLRFFLSLLIM